MAYCELDILTNFTFLTGASHPAEMIGRARELDLTTVGIADVNTLGGVVRAFSAAQAVGQDLRVGSRVVLQCGMTLLVYPKTLAGYESLSLLLSVGKRRADKGECELHLEDIVDGVRDCVVILRDPIAEWKAIDALKAAFGSGLYLGMAPLYDGWDEDRFAGISKLAQMSQVPLVSLGNAITHEKSRRRVADVLCAIRLGVRVDQLGQHALINEERRIKSELVMRRMFRLYPEAIRNTLRIADACAFRLTELKYEYPDEVRGGVDPDTRLRQLTKEGLRWRYPGGVPLKVRAVVEKELALVARMKFAPYFLTVRDITAHARGEGILCQGRGSAANSVVCFALGITEASPDVINMVFERFISEVRGEPPDIDVDFEHQRREEVIQYIFGTYGRERAALCSTVIHFRTRAAFKEVGKALGLSEDGTSALSSGVWGWRDGGVTDERAASVGLDPRSHVVQLALQISREMTGFPRHRSQHPGGFVVTDKRLDALCPIENAAMDDRTVIEWDKNDIDVMGMMKIDVLGLGMLTCVNKAFDLLRTWRGIDLTMATCPQEDPAVYAMISEADTLGVFQIESRAQMQSLPKTRPKTFYDLIVQVALIRPGPIQGDMVHPYLKRRRGEEPIAYPCEALRPVLEKTLGVPLFQEQAMEIAVIAAGFTPSEADHLRRSLASSSGPGSIQIHKDRFIQGCLDNGLEHDFAEQTFRMLEGFSGYGFPQSHAASFALIVYVSCWLKCHHPEVFGCALLNSQPMGFYGASQIVQDMQRHDVEVRPVCAEASFWDCSLEPDSQGRLAVRLGFRQIKGMPEEEARWLTACRANGYRSIDAVWRRAALTHRALEKLAQADAFHSYGLNRNQALWQVKALPRKGPLPLFEDVGEGLIEAKAALRDPDIWAQVYEDYVSTRLTLRQHPISLLSDELGRRTRSGALRNYPDGERVTVSGLVVTRQRPGTAKGTIFLSLEDEDGVANVIVWGESVFPKYRPEVMTGRLLRIHGWFQREGIVTVVKATHIEDLSHLLDSMGRGGERISPSYDNADHVRSPVQSSSSIARDKAASHVPKSGKPDPLGADPKTDRSKDRKDITAYYGHAAARHPRSQAAKLFPSRDFR